MPSEVWSWQRRRERDPAESPQSKLDLISQFLNEAVRDRSRR